MFWTHLSQKKKSTGACALAKMLLTPSVISSAVLANLFRTDNDVQALGSEFHSTASLRPSIFNLGEPTKVNKRFRQCVLPNRWRDYQTHDVLTLRGMPRSRQNPLMIYRSQSPSQYVDPYFRFHARACIIPNPWIRSPRRSKTILANPLKLTLRLEASLT